MKKSVLIGSMAVIYLLSNAQTASAQGAITNGATYKMTHYSVGADGSQTGNGVPTGTPLCLEMVI